MASPLIYACLRLTERWTDFVVERLNVFGQVRLDRRVAVYRKINLSRFSGPKIDAIVSLLINLKAYKLQLNFDIELWPTD